MQRTAIQKFAPYLLAIYPLAVAVWVCQHLPLNTPMMFTMQWIPLLHINISFLVDGLSGLFALIISVIGVFILLYAGDYLSHERRTAKFYVYMLLFMTSMFGLVLSNNLILMFIFWELTSITSFLLVGYNHEKESSRESAVQALQVTMGSGLLLLVGIVLLAQVTGSYSLSYILSHSLPLNSPLVITAMVCIIIGALAKSAQFPFHFWLPDAMAAPTPVSAYLHSATMVKAGVYLLARLHPVFALSSTWYVMLTVAGALTMLVALMRVLDETDLKRILAYTTLIALGAMVYLLASYDSTALKAVLLFIVAHALYKSVLFMSAGTIDHAVGTRHINQLSGLRRVFPVLFIAVALSVFSMAGFPPLIGFIVKELFYEAKLASSFAAPILIAIAVLSSSVMAAAGFKLLIKPFLGARRKVKTVGFWMTGAPIAITLLTIIVSFVPNHLNEMLIEPAARVLNHTIAPAKLAYWHGLTPLLGLSALTVVLAIVFYRYTHHAVRCFQLGQWLVRAPAWCYQRGLQGTIKVAGYVSAWLQNGRLRWYLYIMMMTLAACLLYMSFMLGNAIHWHVPQTNWLNWFICALSALLVIAASLSPGYITGLVLLGTFGLVSALIYLFNAAPDVAMTQILVETLVVVLIVFSLYKQPNLPRSRAGSTAGNWIRLLVSIVIGLGVVVVGLSALAHPLRLNTSAYFIQNAYKLGHGLNVVNVILVDFRALDTLGECVVVLLAALGIFAVIKSYHARGAK